MEVTGDDVHLRHVGVCLLSVDMDAVKMYELNAEDVELVSWPISGIRRFGVELLGFIVETGRCDRQQSCRPKIGAFLSGTSS